MEEMLERSSRFRKSLPRYKRNRLELIHAGGQEYFLQSEDGTKMDYRQVDQLGIKKADVTVGQSLFDMAVKRKGTPELAMEWLKKKILEDHFLLTDVTLSVPQNNFSGMRRRSRSRKSRSRRLYRK
jgi:hypothetical protein